jgi:hypothetical protein
MRERQMDTRYRTLIMAMVSTSIALTPGTAPAAEPAIMALDGEWRFALDHQDTGRGPTEADPFRQSWAEPAFNDSTWLRMPLTAHLPDEGVHRLGIAWYRRTFELPAEWEGRELVLRMPGFGGEDETYVNGQKVGDTSQAFMPRTYRLPEAWIRPGEANVIAIRVDGKGRAQGFVERMGRSHASLAPVLRRDLEPALALRRPLPDSPFAVSALEKRQAIDSRSLFGICGQVIHNDAFYPRMREFWRPEHTLPWRVQANSPWVREPIYHTTQHFVHVSDPLAVEGRRAILENYLEQYEAGGIKVVLCPLFSRHDDNSRPHHGPLFRPFFEYVGELAARFPCIRAIELHNEPNLRHFWAGTPQQYVESARIAAAIIREKAPDTPIITGSISNLWWGPGVRWLETALEEGMLEFSDGLSVHPYRGRRPPEFDGNREMIATEQAILDWWALIQKHNPENRPLTLYFTEVGYSSGRGGLFGLGCVEKQAEYLSRMNLIFFQARLLGVPLEATFWYNLKCAGENPNDVEQNFGLISFDASTARPGFAAQRLLASYFRSPEDIRITRESEAKVSFAGSGDAVKHYVWTRESDGAWIIPFWSVEEMHFEAGDLPTEILVELPPDKKIAAVTLFDYGEDTPFEITFAFDADKSLWRIPAVARSRATWLEIRLP